MKTNILFKVGGDGMVAEKKPEVNVYVISAIL